MEQPARADVVRNPWNVVYALAAVAILYLGRPVLVPVGLSILLTFVVAPLVIRVERRVRSRALAVAIVALVLIGLLGGGALLVGQQFIAFTEDLPGYRNTIARKVEAFQAGPGGMIGRAQEALRGIGDEIARGPTHTPAEPTTETAPDTGKPAAPVVEQGQESGSAAQAWGILRPLVQPLASAAIVMLLMVMMLMSRESIRDRLIRLAGLHQIGLTTQTLEEAGTRVGRYLRAQLLINTIYGTTIGAVLLMVGFPSAALCGLTAGVLRFIPIIGPWIGAAMPAMLALAVFDGWYHVVIVVALFAGLELLCNVVLEPWLYGTRTGLSSFGIVLAIVFWTWAWGGVGLVLAVPITACLVVFARQIPQLGALSILLGDEPALSEPMRYYQRLLCRDDAEASAILASSDAARDPADILDEIVVPGLGAARADLHRGLITGVQAARVAGAAREIAIEWLADRDHGRPPINHGKPAAGVVCIPVSDELDEAAGALLAHMLQRDGITVEVVSGALLFSERIGAAEAPGIGLVVISGVEPFNDLQMRRICKALRRRLPDRPVLRARWGSEPATPGSAAPDEADNAYPSVSRIVEAVNTAKRILGRPPDGGPAPAGVNH